MNGLMIRPVGPFDHAIIASIHARSFAEAWGVGANAELMAAPGAFGLLAAAINDGVREHVDARHPRIGALERDQARSVEHQLAESNVGPA